MKNHWIYLFVICHMCGLIYGDEKMPPSYGSQISLPDKHGYQSVVLGTDKHKYGYQLKANGKHFHHTSTEKDGVRLGCYGYELDGKQYVTQYVADARGYRLVTDEDLITVYPKSGGPEGKASFSGNFFNDEDTPRDVRYFFPRGCKGIDVQIDNSSRLRSLKFSDTSAKLPVTFKPVVSDAYFYNTPPPNYPGPSNIYAPNMIPVQTARPPFAVSHLELPSNTYVTPEKPTNTYVPPEMPTNTYLPPEKPTNTYLPPEKPTNTYLPPEKPTNTYLPPNTAEEVTSEVPSSSENPEIEGFLPEEHETVDTEGPNLPSENSENIETLPEVPNNTYIPPNVPTNIYLPPNESQLSTALPNITYLPPNEESSTKPPIEDEIDLLPPFCPPESSCCKNSLGKIVIPIKLKNRKASNCCNYAKLVLPIKFFEGLDFKKFKQSLPEEIDTNMIIRKVLENLL